MADEEKKSSKMKMLIIILVVLAVDIIGGLVIGMKVIVPMLYSNPQTEEVENQEDAEQEDGPAEPGLKHALEPININPRNSMGDILSIDIVLETADQTVVDELVLRDFEIRDKISSFLAFRSVDELNNQENWDSYKQEMLTLVNNSLSSEGEVTAIYIPNKIIQFQ